MHLEEDKNDFLEKDPLNLDVKLDGFIFDHATSGISFECSADFQHSRFIRSLLSLSVAVALVEKQKLDI